MKPPIRWVLILVLAEAAQGELSHGGVFSVVWQPFDDGEAWSAVCAGDEEIIVAGVVWVAEFFEALVADGYIWGNNGAGVFGFLGALNNREFGVFVVA